MLSALGEQIDAVLDVTVIYPGERPTGFWALLSGQVPRVLIDIQTRPLQPALWQGDYQQDEDYRHYVQHWVSQLWADKDVRIEQYRAELGLDEKPSVASRSSS